MVPALEAQTQVERGLVSVMPNVRLVPDVMIDTEALPVSWFV